MGIVVRPFQLKKGKNMPFRSNVPVRRMMLSLLFCVLEVSTLAQTGGKPAEARTAWTIKVNGQIRWQQVTPAGALLVSTDSALAGVDIERGRITWAKPELGGFPIDSVRPVEGSLLIEAARPGLLMIFDPVTGTIVFDSRRLELTKVITRRVLPQSSTLLVHGQRVAGPPVVALFDLCERRTIVAERIAFRTR
jgi:hypothetical protein